MKRDLIIIALIVAAGGLFFFGYHHSRTLLILGKTASPIPANTEKSVSFTIGGDMMFARMINHFFGKNFVEVVAHLDPNVFSHSDASVINLEGAITNEPIIDNIGPNNFTFKFPPTIVPALDYLHINAASQANNHSDNAGLEGITTTRRVLEASGIQTFGGPRESDFDRVAKFNGRGLSLAIIGINLTFPGQKPEPIVPIIQELKKDPTMRVIVMPHWGVEYSSAHTQAQADAAHLWIDAGADLVIGSHPHVIEDGEVYKGIPIIYSLGNLLFDQTFSQAVQEGLIIKGIFTESGLTFYGIPTQSINYQPQLMTGARKDEILNSLYVPFKNYLNPNGQVEIAR